MTTEIVASAEVPWVFSSVEEEYTALRQRRALFDFSHLGRIKISGRGALDFLQEQVARDITYLFPEKSLTSLMLDEEGRPFDVVVVYKVQGGYILETSVGHGAATLERLRAAAPDEVEVTDLSEELAVVGIEGPFAWEVLGRLYEPQLTGLPYQGVATIEWEGEEVRVSRTGFTGEYGYKLYLPVAAASKAWHLMLEETPPAGYAALETAMLEMRQPMLHREVGPEDNVVRCGLNWMVELDKEDYIGREALGEQAESEPDYLTVGFTAPADLDIATGSTVIAGGELEIGTVAHTVHSPTLHARIGLARTKAEWTTFGLELEVQAPDGARAPIRTVAAPFLIPFSWSVPIL
ncbi:MAG: aminomethyltransferase family protein [Actinobacteria bacterium]|nr:aminomethyltransferase family protein [Actinomycetota bacterium]